ncbi:MAG: hypothetical protein LUF30_06750 [Lachnospiraceae bacterium]|nr:hypothetical protein [Lachnospiraceae bacterium]
MGDETGMRGQGLKACEEFGGGCVKAAVLHDCVDDAGERFWLEAGVKAQVIGKG